MRPRQRSRAPLPCSPGPSVRSMTNPGEMMRKLLLYGLAALAPAMPIPAGASCGAAFCALSTDWGVHGAWTEPGVRVDLRYEYIKQDQPMSGSRRIGVGEIPRHHDEVSTRNRNWLGTIDYTLNQ